MTVSSTLLSAIQEPRMTMRALAASGKMPNAFGFNQFGNNPDIDSGIPEDLWTAGGNYNWPAVAQTMDFVSTSANDTDPAGTGARRLFILGLDTNYDPINEILVLNGVTPVTSANSYLRINNAYVTAAGSQEENDGTITGTGNVSGLVHAHILPSQSRTVMAIFTVRANFTGLITNLYAGAGSFGGATLEFSTELYARFAPGWAWQLIGGILVNPNGTMTPHVYDPARAVPEKTDLRLETLANTNNVNGSGGFGVWGIYTADV